MSIFTNPKLQPLRSGDYRSTVYILQNQPTAVDGMNAPIPNWVNFATVRGQVSTMEGHEVFSAQRIAAETTTRIRIRWYPGIVPGMRAQAGLNMGPNTPYYLYSIIAVIDPDAKQKEMFLLCKAVV